MPGRDGGRRALSQGTFFRVAAALSLLACLLLAASFPTRAAAEDNLFNSSAAVKEEWSRVGEEGKLFIKGPVDPYLPQTLGVAAAFAVSYLYDEDIRDHLAGMHTRTLNGFADFGSFIGNPFLHIGVAVAVYSAGAIADAPRYLTLGEQLGESLLFADGTTFILKEAVGRGRPNGTLMGNSRYKPFSFASNYDSLPSMHTASSFAVAGVLASRTESLPVKILCYTTASFVAFSRLYQQEHWTSDLVLGAAIGTLAGNTVMRYHTLDKGELTVAPVSLNGAPGLAVTGKF